MEAVLIVGSLMHTSWASQLDASDSDPGSVVGLGPWQQLLVPEWLIAPSRT